MAVLLSVDESLSDVPWAAGEGAGNAENTEPAEVLEINANTSARKSTTALLNWKCNGHTIPNNRPRLSYGMKIRPLAHGHLVHQFQNNCHVSASLPK